MTLVGSHAREYGWPSTHTTNAVSIALVGSQHCGIYGKILLAIYALSVIGGRIYCGMHSISDCVGGFVLGAGQHTFVWPLLLTTTSLAATGKIWGESFFACVSLMIFVDIVYTCHSPGGVDCRPAHTHQHITSTR